MRKLLIISHTPHFRRGKTIVGWGATVREIRYLAKAFDSICHIAPVHGIGLTAFQREPAAFTAWFIDRARKRPIAGMLYSRRSRRSFCAITRIASAALS